MDEKKQLEERKKELKCLYQTDKLLSDTKDIYAVFHELIQILSEAFLYPHLVRINISYRDMNIKSAYFQSSTNFISTKLIENGEDAGEIKVYYCYDVSSIGNPFLPEENEMLESVAKRLNAFLSSLNRDKITENNEMFSSIRLEICNDAVNSLDFEMYQIENIYLAGSVKNMTAGSGSDIDLIIHDRGNPEFREKIKIWFSAWSAMAMLNPANKNIIENKEELFELHFISDQNIANNDSYAVMTKSVMNSAKLLKTAKKI
jgi:predicted nucleotidyltransferase